MLGIPLPVLSEFGKAVTKPTAKYIDDYIPLVNLLWHDYGRESHFVALIPLGKMGLKSPNTIIPLLMKIDVPNLHHMGRYRPFSNRPS